MKEYQATRVNLSVLAKDAEKPEEQSNLTEKKAQSVAEETAKAGGTSEQTKVQTFKYYEVESVDELTQLVPNVAEALNIINVGLGAKQNSIVRDLMNDESWPGQEGVYDLATDIAEVRERRKADPLSKAAKAFADAFGVQITPEMLAAFAEQAKAAAGEAQPA